MKLLSIKELLIYFFILPGSKRKENEKKIEIFQVKTSILSCLSKATKKSQRKKV